MGVDVRWLKRAAILVLVPTIVVVLVVTPYSTIGAREAPKDTELGRIVKGDHGTLYMPPGARGDEAWPVLIIEEGLAASDDGGRLWPALSLLTKLIVVETKSQDEVAKAKDSGKRLGAIVDAALNEACSHHWALNRCPWILVGFSELGPATAQLALTNPDRYQGLVLINSVLRPEQLPKDLDAAKAMKVALLHSENDKSIQSAKAVHARLKAAGLDAGMSSLVGEEHKDPVRWEGGDYVLAYLRLLDKTPLAPRWFASPDVKGRRTITTKSADDLVITGDLYETGKRTDPIVLLFHQARSSRGEYRLIAPRLAKAGFNCLAIDQRSGAGWGGVLNESAQRASKAGLKQGYVDARPDLERAIAWARELGFTGKLAICGSSYSAALAIFVGASTPGITSVVSCSPGDYLPPRGSIFEAAAKLKLATLILCPPNEEKQARAVLAPIPVDKDLVVLAKGVHGASMLYRSPNAETAWEKLLQFLRATLKAP